MNECNCRVVHLLVQLFALKPRTCNASGSKRDRVKRKTVL
jgi:hypothetical protein